MYKDSSAKYYQITEKESLVENIEYFPKKTKKKWDNMGMNDIKIFLKDEKQKLVEYRKNIK